MVNKLTYYFHILSLLRFSGAGIDNNHAHPDTSMKLGRNVH